jgi:hypothetical protein
MLKLGTFNKPESFNIENKALHLHPDSISDMSDANIFEMVSIGKWNDQFNTIMETNLLEFIYDIIPKYVSCFSNANCNGVIKIGVDDNSENVGCPYLGNMSDEKIKQTIINTIKERTRGPLTSDDINKQVSVKIVPLAVDVGLLTDEAEIYYQLATKDLMDYNNRNDEYLEQHGLFLVKHRKYTQQLEKMLNITRYRLELSEYIRKESFCNVHITELLESDKYIKLKLDNIENDKEDINSVFYWITRFRTLRKKQISSNKPVRPRYPSIYHPNQILCNLPYMRKKFIEQNPNIKYYIIQIDLRFGRPHKLENPLEYLTRYSKKWISRTRINNSDIMDGPSCTSCS